VKPFYLSNRSTYQNQLVPLHQAEKARLAAEQKAITFAQERVASSAELLEERKKHELDKVGLY
jgi:hypothetical protein